MYVQIFISMVVMPFVFQDCIYKLGNFNGLLGPFVFFKLLHESSSNFTLLQSPHVRMPLKGKTLYVSTTLSQLGQGLYSPRFHSPAC